MSQQFDLEKAIAAWRRPYEHDRTFQRDDLDELEGNLRDRVAAFVASGMSEEAAFAEAVRRMGDYGSVEGEYRKLFWDKLRRQGTLAWHVFAQASMLKNYVLVAFRNLRRHPAYTAINLLGLAIGMAACLMVLLYVRDELSYDRHHRDLEQLYRIQEVIATTGVEWASTPWQPMEILRNEFGDRIDVARIRRQGPGLIGDVTVRRGDKKFVEYGFFFADPTILDVLTIPLVAGNPDRVLVNGGDLIISERAARKYFGAEDPLGEVLIIDEAPYTYTVTGIFENAPANSHLSYDFISPMHSTWNPSPGDGSPWLFNIYYTYVKVPDPALIPLLEQAIQRRQKEQRPSATPSEFRFVPVADIHLHSRVERELYPNGDIRIVYLFSGIGVLMLIVACINFVNLTTARSTGRAREVGVRKVLGAHRGQIARQFLSEAVLLALGAALLALLLTAAALPAFNGITGKALVLNLLDPWWMPLVVLGVALVTGVLAGSYPAVYLSAFRPVRVLKGTLWEGRPRVGLREALIVVQFTLSTALLVGAFAISRQLEFLRQVNLGLDKEQILVIDTRSRVGEQFAMLKDELKRVPFVQSVTTSDVVPGEQHPVRYFRPEGGAIEDTLIGMRRLIVEADFAETYGLEIVAGRDFSETAKPGEERAYVINEAAARFLGWDDPVGKRINNGEVIGVVKDFNFASLHDAVEPLVISNGGGHGEISIKLAAGNLSAAVARIERNWTDVVPNEPFNFYFLDQSLDRQYRAERSLQEAFRLFSALIILVACMGLFGLAAFTAERRTKEIGVRKVLGATVPGIVTLLSRDILKPVGVAVLIAIPVSWLAVRRWLDGFAYQANLGVSIFLGAAVLVLLIALATVSYHAIRAALANPVESLRYE